MKTVFPPWAYNLKQSPDSLTFNRLIKMATAINGYGNGIYIPISENFPVNGDVSDWMYGETNEKNRIFAVLTEVSNYVDEYWPKPERILPLSEEHLYSNLVYSWGPGIIENPPYISEGSINISGYLPLKDTLISFNAVEHNPDNHTSNVYAQVLNSKDSIIQEILLTQTDSAFNGSLEFNSPDEDFYKVRYKQSGIDIPSNLYYSDKNKLRFTTVWPVVLDSISITKNTTSYSVKTFIKNESANTKITKASVKLICKDPWVQPLSANLRSLPDISPGGVVSHSGTFLVKQIDALFNGIFNFKVQILSDGVPYWNDSLQVIVGANKIEDVKAITYKLDQNYPNPFNSTTTIGYGIKERSNVKITILNAIGKEIAIVINSQKEAGNHKLEFNAASLPAGVYYYQIKAGEFVQTKKMIVLK